MKSNLPVVVVEGDPCTRLIGVVLDPTTSEERRAAFADFMSPDEPNFVAWCDALRARAGALYHSEVRLVSSQAELRNIDVAACAAAGVKVLGVRRRANIACAEHAFALMLALARRIHRIAGLNSIERLSAAKFPYKPFDRRHV